MTPRTYDPQATREALLRAASDLFARQGYAGTTVDAIARRARVNKAMISYHFGGKRKLYQAIVRDTLGAAVSGLEETRRSGRSAEERLRAFIRLFGELVGARPALPAMLLREALSGGTNLDPRTRTLFLQVLEADMEILLSGVRDRSFRPVHPIAAHLSLVGSLVFFFATSPFRRRMLEAAGEGSLDDREFVAQLEEIFVRGLSAEKPAQAQTQGARS